MTKETTKEPTFEESLKLLEERVDALSRGDLPLDRALAIFEEGLALYRRCHAILADSEQRVTKLVAAAEGLTEEPFLVE
jgi:exodeoxyribonuclease VII small subunit